MSKIHKNIIITLKVIYFNEIHKTLLLQTKTVESITLIKYTKFYCLKTSCHKRDQCYQLIVYILTGLN